MAGPQAAQNALGDGHLRLSPVLRHADVAERPGHAHLLAPQDELADPAVGDHAILLARIRRTRQLAFHRQRRDRALQAGGLDHPVTGGAEVPQTLGNVSPLGDEMI